MHGDLPCNAALEPNEAATMCNSVQTQPLDERIATGV